MSFRRGVRTESTSHILDNDYNSVTSRKQKLRKYLAVSLRINVCLVIPLLALIVTRSMLFEQDKQDAKERDVAYKAANSENGVCLPCDSLGPGIKVETTLFDSIQYTKYGGKICCYQEQPYLQIMISRMMDPQITKPIPEIDRVISDKMKWWRSRKNSIHMYLDLDRLGENNIVWSTDNDYLGTAYMNNMVYNETINSVELLQAGIYFIYSAITFDFGDISLVDLYNHEVKRWHRLLPKTVYVLLKSRFGGSSESERIYTSFLCGAFTLDNNTNVMIEVTRKALGHVKKSKYANYFGIVMV